MWHRLFIHGNEDDGGEFQYTIESIDVNGDQSVIYMSLLENALIRTSVTGSCC